MGIQPNGTKNKRSQSAQKHVYLPIKLKKKKRGQILVATSQSGSTAQTKVRKINLRGPKMVAVAGKRTKNKVLLHKIVFLLLSVLFMHNVTLFSLKQLLIG